MRCTNCGHQGSPGATFCLNCGTRLAPAAPAPSSGGTHRGSGGLPPNQQPQTPANKICMRCNADNAMSMKFCRQCGAPLGDLSAAPQAPSGAAMQVQQQPEIPSTLVEPQAGSAPLPVVPRRRTSATPPPGSLPRASTASGPVRNDGPQQCSICGGDTPGGFTFCQRCGKPLNPPGHVSPAPAQAPAAMQPVAATPAAAQAPAAMQPVAATPAAAQAPAAIQPVATTPAPRPASPAGRRASSQRPTPRSVQIPVAAGPAWASLTCVNRDGSDGDRHDLRGEYVEIGSNPNATIYFDDPFLAGCHARIERRGTGGACIVPVDRLNGVFRRLRQDVTLADGAVVLLGRELVRFELLKKEEVKPVPLTQHGVTLFGSPTRESWGRIMQMLPNAGVRDVRHLYGDEVVVGREEGELVFGDDEFLSRRHAAFRWKHGQCVLSDLGSSNGTFIRLSQPSNLSDGDFLRIGDQMFRFKPE